MLLLQFLTETFLLLILKVVSLLYIFKMDTLHKKILETFFNVPIQDGDLLQYYTSPKSGISCWVGYSKNLKKSLDRSTKKLGVLCKDPNNDLKEFEDSILDIMFSDIIISKDRIKAIKAMKRAKPGRDYNMFEINQIKVDGTTYTIVWD